mgnify:CR=1 FL=1
MLTLVDALSVSGSETVLPSLVVLGSSIAQLASKLAAPTVHSVLLNCLMRVRPFLVVATAVSHTQKVPVPSA